MAGRKTPQQQQIVATTPGTTVLSFGCLGGVCVATEQYPLHLGMPGDHVYMVALNTDITIKFTAKSPFVSGSKKFTILKGQSSAVETVANFTNGTKFRFTLSCASGCPTPTAGPEMIIP